MIARQSSNQFTLVAAALLLAGVTALAQQPNTNPGGTPGQQQQPMPGETGYPVTTQGAIGSPADNPEIMDQSFMRQTLQDNKAQVEMSQLAEQKSSSDDVKQYSQQMVQLHTQLTDQLMPVARQLGVKEPGNPSKNQKRDIARLQSLSGPDFDAAYIQLMAREQQHSLKQFQEESKMAQDPDVQQAAKMDTPVLSQHYQVLQKLAQTHNVTLAGK